MAEQSMIEALSTLRADGYVVDFHAESGRLVCGGCSHELDPTSVEIEHVYRFEGESDPDDEAAVFGLRCGACGLRGVYVVAYGPSMAAEDAAVLPLLVKRPSN